MRPFLGRTAYSIRPFEMRFSLLTPLPPREDKLSPFVCAFYINSFILKRILSQNVSLYPPPIQTESTHKERHTEREEIDR